MAVIVVKKRKILMDDKDYEMVLKFSSNSIQIMQGKGKNYPHACIRRREEDGSKLYFLSRLIMKVTDPGKRVVFVDGNTLNLHRANLKVVEAGVASRKRIKVNSGTSQYIGVHWASDAGKWRATFKLDNTSSNEHLGYFVKEDEAAKAYDRRAKAALGKLAHLNFPEKQKKKPATKKVA